MSEQNANGDGREARLEPTETPKKKGTPPPRRAKAAGENASPIIAINWQDADRARVKAAARALGCTVSDFIRDSSLQRAKRVLEGAPQHVIDMPSHNVPLIAVLPNELADLVYRPDRAGNGD